jgi:glycerophosphoryl diester phosphodiesterase
MTKRHAQKPNRGELMAATPTLDRSAFIRPIAHRGWHDAATGRIENTTPAFEAALARGLGIECDLQPAADGTPHVFHDDTLDRLTDATGPFAARTPADLAHIRHRTGGAAILTFADFLALVGGRVPLLVEIKSDWTIVPAFLDRIATLAKAYRGPLALMSFDPAVMAAIAVRAPSLPRGIVSGSYEGAGWWQDRLLPERRERLRHLLESRETAPSFYAYEVKALPTPVTRYVREVQGLPLFTWTVRSAEDRTRAATHADAPIFEGDVP